MNEERQEMLDEFDRRVARRLRDERRWRRKMIALTLFLGIALLLALVGLAAVLFVIYAVFFAAPAPPGVAA